MRHVQYNKRLQFYGIAELGKGIDLPDSKINIQTFSI